MKHIQFKNIFTSGEIVFQDDLYAHIYDSNMPLYYDGNFITFKQMPTIDSFKEVEAYLAQYHKAHNQQHLKFCFPADEQVTDEWRELLIEKGYEIGFVELYALNPSHFRKKDIAAEIEVYAVNEENYADFEKLQYEQDVEFGTDFADLKSNNRKKDFLDTNKFQILSFYKGKPAGTVDIILTQETAEIDNLNVVLENRNKGIGSALQQFAMDKFPDKTFILLADGEDTAREMYRKQNYQYQGLQYEILKTTL